MAHKFFRLGRHFQRTRFNLCCLSFIPRQRFVSHLRSLTTSPKTDEKIQQSSQSFQGNVKPPPGAKFSETTATAIHTDWYESETEYHIAARFLVGIDTSNMHLYVEKGNIVIEATRDIKARNESTADPISKRTSLFLRRTIEIPPDADLTKISSKLVGDTIVISIPKI